MRYTEGTRKYAGVLANIALCLIHQANHLLDQLIRRLEKDFVEKGGLRERMTRARITHREGRTQRTTIHS